LALRERPEFVSIYERERAVGEIEEQGTIIPLRRLPGVPFGRA
jgi:hypothetical protein